MKTIYTSIVVLAIAGVISFVFSIALERNDLVQCERLENQAEEYKDFKGYFISKEEARTCKALGFEINARVK